MKFVNFFLCAILCWSCSTFNQVKNQLSGSSPHKNYFNALEKSGLDKTELGIKWKEAGESVFKDSIFVKLPYAEGLHFRSSAPDARSYRFSVKQGQVLSVAAQLKAKPGNLIFIDLFSQKEDMSWELLASADSTLAFQHEFDKDAECLLRVQPELLIDAFISLTVSVGPSLLNPVKGATNKSIGSFFGAVRDGGKRLHEGVDIFAPKGTPVLAPANGIISSVGNSKLGGKVVWMFDPKRNNSYYFAHLDTQLVSIGKISEGDTLGTVGNTGNARLTPPHLHFGIYRGGSKDPLHYLKTFKEVNPVNVDTSLKIADFRVTNNAKLFSGPGKEFAELKRLEKMDYVQVVGYQDDWFRVKLANDQEGYISGRLIQPASSGKVILSDSVKMLLAEPITEAVPVETIPKNGSMEVLAKHNKFQLVKLTQSNGITGWVKK